MSIPAGHHVMHLPHPTQPEVSNWSHHVESLWVIQCLCLDDIDERTFCEDTVVFQIGVAPRRIDIIAHIDGVDFEQACNRKQDIEIDGLKVPFISKEYLIKNKEATGRDKDKLDAAWLRSTPGSK